ncbi:MAG TPA: hypothetical protein VKU85_04900, partial [bacterium]|nr:hypothetical protein [bacterium]
LAFRWDTRIRSGDDSLSLVSLLREARDLRIDAGDLEGPVFLELAQRYGVDAREDFQRYVLDGEPFDWSANAVPSNVSVVQVSVPRFDPGFSVRDSYRNGVVTGVSPGGPAYQAGLRNGMTFRYCKNASRFSNAWRSDRPLTVLVTVDGEMKSFDYLPRGAPRTVRAFLPASP